MSASAASSATVCSWRRATRATRSSSTRKAHRAGERAPSCAGQKRVEDARERAYDPRIHLLCKKLFTGWMDCRVKPGNDTRIAGLVATRAPLRRHLRPDLRAQRIDREQAVPRIDVPEGPAVARLQALRQRANAVNRADPLTQADPAAAPHHPPHLP